MSSIATDEDIVDRWIELDDSISVPEQTLDEILADKILDLDEEILSGPDDEESVQFTSPRQSRPISPVSYTLDSPLRLTELEYITYQLKRESDRCSGGHASALAVSNAHITVGTSRGLMLIFSRENQSARRMACLDSGGSVYELKLSTTIRSRRTRCVFSGCHGEVVHLKTLDNGRILALLSLKKLFLVSLREMRLVYTVAFHGPASRPPLIDWQIVNIKGDAKNIAFCAGRGSKIEFYYLNTANRTLKVERYRVLSLNLDMINLKWIEPFYLLVVDADEKTHLIDVTQGEVAVEDICNVQLVYDTADFKGLSTGGNVSAALEYLADFVCYQSLYRLGNITFLLGQSSVHMITLSDQMEQLERFIDRGEVVSAVLFAVDIFLGKVVSRTRQANLQRLVSSRIPDIIQALLNLTTTGLANGKVLQLVDHYKKHIQLLIRVCIVTSRFDLLYNTVYACLQKDLLSKAVFFEFIDEVVLDGQLDDPPPELVSDYFHHLIAEGNLSQFEAAVVRIPIERQDVHFVLTTCRANRLYDGVIYVYNKAMSDYLGPLEEIFENMVEFVGSEVLSDCEIAQGNKLLLYIQCCLSARAYPFGYLPKEVADVLPLQVYRCLISYKGKDGISALATYPYLRLLIMFDAVQFFNVIFTCSDCKLFSSEEGRLQRLVELIYQIINSVSRDTVLFMNYFTLLTHLLQKKAILPSLDTVSELVEMALSVDVPSVHIAEAERCVVEVMRIVNGLDEMKILRMARRLPQREFTSLVQCYLSDSVNAVFVFPLIRTLLLELHGDELRRFYSFLWTSLQKLAKIDYQQTAELILDHFMEWLRKEELEDSETSLLYYYCFSARRDRGYRTLTDFEERDEQLLALAMEGIVENNLFEDLDTGLLEFLRYWLKAASRTDRCLNYTISHGLIESSVLLLEARKLIERAFELLHLEMERIWLKNDTLISKYICETIRLANNYHEEARRGSWLFKILHRILSLPQSELRNESGMMVTLNNVITAVMESGSSDAERLVDVLFAHPAFRCATYAEFRLLITSMFATCRYEGVLLEETVRCIEKENVQMLSDLLKQSTRRCAGPVTSDICISCRSSLNKSSYLYSCGHIMHIDCQPQNSVRHCPCQTNGFGCPTVESNLIRSPDQRIRKLPRVNIFAEESLRLALGPNRMAP